MSIYFETHIAGTIEDLLHKTQRPELHEHWDLRFTHIEYLPRPDESEPQRFLYSTVIAPSIEVSGRGEASGTRISDLSHTASLKFWSEDPKSLISKGSGYWNYEQHTGFVRFRTRYDYQTQFGFLGRLFDRIVFRPLLGWATAWSFDRLRLWIEKGIDPSVSAQSSLVHAIARLTLVFIWLYQGIVPKLLTLNDDEVALLAATGLPETVVPTLVRAFGILEVALAILLLLTWNRRWPLLLNAPLMLVSVVGVALTSPAYLSAALNPVTLNLAVAVLALIAYLVGADLPSAGRCMRKENKP